MRSRDSGIEASRSTVTKEKGSMRVVAILAAYNEERFIGGCLEHLFEQGVEAYLIDNCSTDRTVEIAERYLKRGLIDIETLPRTEDVFKQRPIHERKEELAATLEADWFIHVDADEIRLPPRSDRTLAQAFAEVEAKGYNAVNFMEFVFVPTREAPDHDHPSFQQTMRWYYPFQRSFPQWRPHRRNAWKRQVEKVDLAGRGGHRVRFPGLRLYPEFFKMRHYLFLSVPHALRKWVDRNYDETEVEKGWHGWRAGLTPERIRLPSQKELRYYTSDDELDPSNPLTRHIWVLP
jgi:glycosyltransferase involved in cell wall biosynthesis